MNKFIKQCSITVVLAVILGSLVGTSASAYVKLGCRYASGSINPITYRFYSVGDSSLTTATKYGANSWNATTAPGTFQETTTSLDPEVNVTDSSNSTANYYAVINYTCSNGLFSGNEVNLAWNNATVSSRTTSQKYRIATHELGHAYGLDHVTGGCHIMRFDVGYMTNCLITTPSSDDVAGANAVN